MQNIIQKINEKINQFFSKRNVLKSVTILTGGTTLAQAITVLASPIITRLYSPEDFGILSTFFSVTSFLVVLSTLRYELAIPNVEDDKVAFYILFIALGIAMIFSVIIFVILFLYFEHGNLFWSELEKLKRYFYFIPLFLVGSAFYQVFNIWAVRKKQFNSIAKTKIIQSLGNLMTSTTLGLFKIGTLGLLIGNFIGSTGGVSIFIKNFLKENINFFNKNLDLLKGISLFKRFFKFATFSTLQSIINVLSLQLIVFLLLHYYGSQVVGYYYLSYRIMALPSILIGTSVSQVFWSEAAILVKENPVKLKSLFFLYAKKLFLLSIPIAILGLISPFVYEFLFGKEWEKSGFFALILSLMVITNFIFGTLDVFSFFEKLIHWHLIWDLLRFLSFSSLFFIIPLFQISDYQALLIYSILYSVFIILVFLLNLRACDYIQKEKRR